MISGHTLTDSRFTSTGRTAENDNLLDRFCVFGVILVPNGLQSGFVSMKWDVFNVEFPCVLHQFHIVPFSVRLRSAEMVMDTIWLIAVVILSMIRNVIGI